MFVVWVYFSMCVHDTSPYLIYILFSNLSQFMFSKHARYKMYKVIFLSYGLLTVYRVGKTWRKTWQINKL